MATLTLFLCRLLPALLILLGGLPEKEAASPPAAEKILDFHSVIVIHPDASLTVTESITVRSAAMEIRRGIVREFPTSYKDRLGNMVKVGFELQEVLRDGRPEPFHVQEVENGKKIYLGDKNVFLPPGEYTYRLTYRTTRQLGFFQDFDELYWNVTGNGWTLPIERAVAVVVLPPGGRVLNYAAYTGYRGEKGRDFKVSFDAEGNLVFATTRPFRPREGLTIAVSWPKGLVAEPSTTDKAGFLLGDNLTTLVALVGLGAIFLYYLAVWSKVGKDPPPGIIIPLFSPPPGFSPPMVRYLMRYGYDHKVFAAAVVDMAVKGYLKIKEDNGTFVLERTDRQDGNLDDAEKSLGSALFRHQKSVSLEASNHKRLQAARQQLRQVLEKTMDSVYFHSNRRYFLTGLALSLVTLLAMVLTASSREALFPLLWLSLWSLGCFFLAKTVYQRWRGVRSGARLRLGRAFAAVVLTLFSLPFFLGELFGFGLLARALSLPASLALAFMLLINLFFYYLLKAPTRLGRAVMDQIEGFKMYLATAEQERLESLHPPEKTPELFEKYLPYALALEVENEWSEQFAEVLARAQEEDRTYQPSWYAGNSWDHHRLSAFATALGSTFSSAIDAATAPPGSISGSGGGGSSGGGGGGGGGSGW